jgi:putative phosphoribosyl transferase
MDMPDPNAAKPFSGSGESGWVIVMPDGGCGSQGSDVYHGWAQLLTCMAIHEDPSLRDRAGVFHDRTDAGAALGRMLRRKEPGRARVLAIPAGGLPVAREVAFLLSADIDVLVVRKVQLPRDPEAGMGAVGPGGAVILNERLIDTLGLTGKEVERQVDIAARSVEAREHFLRGDRPYPSLRGMAAIIVDDGLASGYTMLAAISASRMLGSSSVIVAVPTGSAESVRAVSEKADELYCLNIRTTPYFAVADAYQNWSDLDEARAKAIVDEMQERSAAHPHAL